MGKMGAGELNYSSDIDLIVFFDPPRRRLRLISNRSRSSCASRRACPAAAAGVPATGYGYSASICGWPDRSPRRRLRSQPPQQFTIMSGRADLGARCHDQARPCARDPRPARRWFWKSRPSSGARHLDLRHSPDVVWHEMAVQICSRLSRVRARSSSRPMMPVRSSLPAIDFVQQHSRSAAPEFRGRRAGDHDVLATKTAIFDAPRDDTRTAGLE